MSKHKLFGRIDPEACLKIVVREFLSVYARDNIIVASPHCFALRSKAMGVNFRHKALAEHF